MAVITQEYSTHMEKLASNWANRCKFEHPDPKKYTEYKGLGQNIAVSGGASFNVTNLMHRWYKEVFDYDFYENRCRNGKMCGHYTQVGDVDDDQSVKQDYFTLNKIII